MTWGDESIPDAAEPNGLDHAIEVLMAVTLLFTPMAFGTTEAWSQQLFYIAVTLMVLLAAVRLLVVGGARVAFSWAFVPMALYLLMVALSILPLPADVVKAFSPGTVQTKSQLLADLPNAAQLLERVTISYNVWSTEWWLRIVIALSAVFVVVVQTYRTPEQIKRLLGSIALAGTAVAVLAIAQDLTQTRRSGEPVVLFWTFPMANAHPGAGPFIGHAQIGQYLNLVLGAMLALVVVRIAEAFEGEDLTGREVVERLDEPHLRMVYVLLPAMLVVVAAIMLSSSRGAAIAMVGAGLVAFVLLLRKRGWHARETPMLIGAGAGAVVVLAIVAAVVLIPRLEKRNAAAAQAFGTRVKLWEDSLEIVKTFPVMGSGLASFEWVHPMFDRRNPPSQTYFTDAENDYLQTLTDTGIVGGALTLTFVAMMAWHWRRGFAGNRPIHLASVGIAYALIATMIHSVGDFAQRTAAIGFVTAALLGLTVALSRMGRTRSARSPGLSLAATVLGAGFLLIGLAWTLYTNNVVRQGEAVAYELDWHWGPDAISGERVGEDDPVAWFDERINGSAQAAALDPKAVQYIYAKNAFVWRKLRSNRDETTGRVIYPAGAGAAAEQIVRELTAARALCPVYGPSYGLMGKVQHDLLNQRDEGLKNVELSRRLAPSQAPMALFLTEIHADAGRWEQATDAALTLMRIDNRYAWAVFDVLVKQHRRPELLLTAFGENALYMEQAAYRLRGEAEFAPVVQQMQTKLLELTEQAAHRPGASSNDLVSFARAAARQGQHQRSADAYATALMRDYSNVQWRLERARALADAGKTTEAIGELNTCLQLRPQMTEASDLLERLVLAPPNAP